MHQGRVTAAARAAAANVVDHIGTFRVIFSRSALAFVLLLLAHQSYAQDYRPEIRWGWRIFPNINVPFSCINPYNNGTVRERAPSQWEMTYPLNSLQEAVSQADAQACQQFVIPSVDPNYTCTCRKTQSFQRASSWEMPAVSNSNNGRIIFANRFGGISPGESGPFFFSPGVASDLRGFETIYSCTRPNGDSCFKPDPPRTCLQCRRGL
jgi:hypothetical protein